MRTALEAPPAEGRAAPAPLRTAALAGGALVCFAANSLLCRAALGRGLSDPATFAAVRLASGAAAVALPVLAARRAPPSGGSWGSALVLFAYAVTFSLAYVRIGAGVGALVLFAAVQATMVGWGVASGARLGPVQWAGVALATGGLAWLTLPGAEAPDGAGAVLMALAGVAWGVYSVRGRNTTDPLSTTADNLVRTAPLGLLFLAAGAPAAHATPAGIALAVVSGAVATGGGYALWYAALPALGASRAGTLQLSVPVIAGVGAVVLLGEPVTHRLWGAGAAILCGVALAVTRRR
ncbi:MAG TPA: DMT family transporter [Anaeromyxobacter sp.]|nr:DMT family transporter [Anaeromyxobacter sp.]